MKSLFFGLLLVTSIAQADYVKGGITLTSTAKLDYKDSLLSPTTDRLARTALFPLIVAYGKTLKETTHVEFEFSIRDHEYRQDVGRTVTATGLAVNIIDSFRAGIFRIMGGAGLGYGIYDSGFSAQSTEYAPSWQIFAGLDYPMGDDHTTIGFEFRHMSAFGDIDFGGGAKASYRDNAVIVTAKYGW